MSLVSVKSVDDGLIFSDGSSLHSEHRQDCCESHYLSFDNLSEDDFGGLLFDLSGQFFNKVEDYGIELIPTNGWPVRIPGYGHNNGYYSTELILVVTKPDGSTTEYDITECQVIND